MRIKYHKNFDKQFKKLTLKKRAQVKSSIALLVTDPYHETLRDHPLRGEWLYFRSISAGGDLRIHYKKIDSDTIIIVAVGTHSQLYK